MKNSLMPQLRYPLHILRQLRWAKLMPDLSDDVSADLVRRSFSAGGNEV